MSNLLKRVYTVNKDERVIDYNDLIKKKLEAIMESKHAAVDTDGFVSGLNADVVEELISDDSSEELIQDRIQSLLLVHHMHTYPIVLHHYVLWIRKIYMDILFAIYL